MIELPKFPKLDKFDKYGIPVYGAYKEYYIKTEKVKKGFVTQLKLNQTLDLNWVRKEELPKHKYLKKFIEQERFVQGYLAGYLSHNLKVLETLK